MGLSRVVNIQVVYLLTPTDFQVSLKPPLIPTFTFEGHGSNAAPANVHALVFLAWMFPGSLQHVHGAWLHRKGIVEDDLDWVKAEAKHLLAKYIRDRERGSPGSTKNPGLSKLSTKSFYASIRRIRQQFLNHCKSRLQTKIPSDP